MRELIARSFVYCGILCAIIHENWSKNLCYVTYVINTSVSESTKVSRFSIIYGTEATSVLGLCLPEEPENVPKTIAHAYNIGLII